MSQSANSRRASTGKSGPGYGLFDLTIGWKKVYRRMLTVLTVVVLFCTSAYAGQPDSATGAGFFGFDPSRVFAFTATRQKDGSVVGQGVVMRPHSGLASFTWHFAVNCLNVVDNVATLSGVLTDYKEFGSNLDLTGSHFWVRVIDNGEGRKASKDQMTYVWIDDPANCTEDCVPDCNGELPIALPPETISSGNIQVRQQTQ